MHSPPKCIPRQNFWPTVWCVHFISPTTSLSLFPSPWYNVWATTAAVCTKQVVLSVTFLPTPPNYHFHACAHMYLRVPTCGYSVVLATYMVSHVCWFACVCAKRDHWVSHTSLLQYMVSHVASVYMFCKQLSMWEYPRYTFCLLYVCRIGLGTMVG